MLPQVLVNLHEGGFATYVSASRAQTREGLFLTETVSLENLNRPVSSDLRHECHWLERLEYNTRVRYGLEVGSILPMLNPESEIDDISNPDVGSTPLLPMIPAASNQSPPLPKTLPIAPLCFWPTPSGNASLPKTMLTAPPHLRPNPANCALLLETMSTTPPHLRPDLVDYAPLPKTTLITPPSLCPNPPDNDNTPPPPQDVCGQQIHVPMTHSS